MTTNNLQRYGALCLDVPEYEAAKIRALRENSI